MFLFNCFFPKKKLQNNQANQHNAVENYIRTLELERDNLKAKYQKLSSENPKLYPPLHN